MHFFRRHDRGRPPHPDVLTPAEWRVLQHVRQRRTNAEIAVRLGLSVNTVRTHVSSMLAKLEMPDREELARWTGEPAPVSRVALQRRIAPAGGPVVWFREVWMRIGPVVQGLGAVAVAGSIAAAVFLAGAASRDQPDDVNAPHPSPVASAASPEPTPTPAPIVEWMVGQPTSWPEGMTLVLGTGCYLCGGQYSTFGLVDATSYVQMPKAEGEEHLTGAFDDPSHLYLATCVNDCNVYTETPADPQAVVYESLDRGVTWTAVGQSPTLWQFVGRLVNGELLRAHYVPQPAVFDRFPSSAPVRPPSAAPSSSSPRVIDGEVFWWDGNSRLLDENGGVGWDFKGRLPAAAEAWNVVDGPGSALAVAWRIENKWGVTIIDRTSVRTYSSPGLAVQEFEWLDADRLIASIPYPLDALEALGADTRLRGSRIPTVVDLRTGTLRPLERFLDVTDHRLFGRNSIEAIWQN
jgi:DNA-binding CsgD family transcriptional regulator